MAWSTNKTWTTGELVTAADLNTYLRDQLDFLAGTQSSFLDDTATAFTNTSFADLDALSADAFNAPVAVTVNTMTEALVILSVRSMVQNTGGDVFFSYRVSGASTIASADTKSARSAFNAGLASRTFTLIQTGLTEGSNTFEMQARVSANNATAHGPSLTVIPLP